MILNSIFVLCLLMLCYTRHKEVCKDCGTDKARDIFQILFVGIAFAYFIGVGNVILMALVLLFSFVIREVLFYPFDKIKKKKCTNCVDNFR